MLKVQNLEVKYGEIVGVRAVDLEVNQGEVVALLGANGAGKSTTLKTISGLLAPSKGTVTFMGKNISAKSAQEVSKLGITHVPEGRRVFPGLTVEENLEIGTAARGRLPSKQIKDEIYRVLEIFPELKTLYKALGWQLSGGQQQMLAIGRALMSKPKILLLDEPSLGLAPIIVQKVFETLRSLNEKENTTILLVEQNVKIALRLATRGYVIENGRVILSGRSDDLISDKKVQAAYLGQH